MPATAAPHRTPHDIAPNPKTRTRRIPTPGDVARPLTARPLVEEAPVVVPQPELDVRAEVSRAARRRRRHRAMRFALPIYVLAPLLLAELLALVGYQAQALASRDKAAELDKKIARTRAGMAATQERIAEIDASPQVGRWAQDGGWKLAEQGDFDDITDRRPRPLPEQIAAPKAKAGEAR